MNNITWGKYLLKNNGNKLKRKCALLSNHITEVLGESVTTATWEKKFFHQVVENIVKFYGYIMKTVSLKTIVIKTNRNIAFSPRKKVLIYTFCLQCTTNTSYCFFIENLQERSCYNSAIMMTPLL